MYKRAFLLAFFLFVWCYNCTAQTDFNGNFENIDSKTSRPKGWAYGFNKTQEATYPTKLDSLIKNKGKYSVSIEKKEQGEGYSVIESVIAENYKGGTIDLVGHMKTEGVAKGFAGLWLRLDGEGGRMLKLDNMEQQAITGTNDWKQYFIKLPYEGDVRSIHFGGLLAGEGKAWFDDLEIYIDGKKIETLKPRVLAAAETDSEFNKSSKIQSFAPNQQQIKNIAVSGQFWGFLKYHHPAIAKGDYNWDAELFRFLPSVIDAKNNAELSAALEKYLDKLPQIAACKSCSKINLVSTSKPNYGDLLTGKLLSSSISKKLSDILQNSNIKENYYVAMNDGVGNPKFQNERAYEDMKYPDAGYRILSLYRYWNMINYFFPYKYQMDEDWNKVLYDFVPQFLSAENDLGYNLAALKLIAKISDTHANLWNKHGVLDQYKGMNTAPFKATFIENKLIVTGFYLDTLGIKNKLKIGDEILTINGKKVGDLVQEFLPITAASNYDTQLRDLPKAFLLRTSKPTMALGFKNEKETFDLEVPMVNVRLTYKNIDYTKPTGYHLLNDKVGYVYPAKYKNTDLKDIKKLFENTNGIVIDMRCYPSDFMPFTFGEYIKQDKTPFVKFTTGSVAQPGTFVVGKDLMNGGNKNAYKGKVVVIVNAESQSNAEYTTMAFQSSPNVKVIGSQTAGADGNVSTIVLPGGISSWISGIGVFYPDGKPTQRVGVRLDYPIKPTVKGITEGKDELLEKAVSVLEAGW